MKYSIFYSSAWHYYFTHAADVCGDARLELLAGSKAYDVVIADRTGFSASNTMIPICSISDADAIINGTLYKDGPTLVVDINRDGRLDVVYRTISAKKVGIIAWDVQTQQVIANVEFTDNIVSSATAARAGIPFIGDIDGNDDLELLLTTTNRLKVFDVDISTKQFIQRPEITVKDDSGETGITLFDFNQDGTAELIYRDEATLQIYNVTSSGLIPVSGSGILCRSATLAEYPLVADVDNDGSAEIVTIGIPTNAGNYITTVGSLFIIKSQTAGAWAPSRKVWNQYAYNVVNINEDLTVPRYQLNPATFFPGENGAFNIQPYNSFLQQQTSLSKNGTPLWLTPDVKLTETPTFSYYSYGDLLVISMKLTNAGDAPLIDYPDIRIRICPDGNSVNLSKYLDTLFLTSIKWESLSPAAPVTDVVAGTVSTDRLKAPTVYTFTYTVSNPCATDVRRKVYLEALRPDRMRPLRDTVAICYEYTEALQINQLFGIEARGDWSYLADGNITPYITESNSAIHDGAVVMNGKEIYENIPTTFLYHGIATKRVKVSYTPATGSCLAGNTYSIVIILTGS